jgi:hypothetical protein
MFLVTSAALRRRDHWLMAKGRQLPCLLTSTIVTKTPDCLKYRAKRLTAPQSGAQKERVRETPVRILCAQVEWATDVRNGTAIARVPLCEARQD